MKFKQEINLYDLGIQTELCLMHIKDNIFSLEKFSVAAK